MRQILIATFCLSLLFSCHKENNIPNPPAPTVEHIIELGKVAYKRDGVLQEHGVKTYLIQSPRRYFAFTYSTFQQAWEDKIGFSEIPCKVGKYPIEDDINFVNGDGIPYAELSWSIDIDQFIGGLRPDESKPDNYMEVIRYDSIEEIAEGRFQVALKNFDGGSLTSFGLKDSIKITEGRFHLKLK